MSVDPRRTQPFCEGRCYRECRCSRWPSYRNRFGFSVSGSYDSHVLSTGPIAYWPLWETSGLVAQELIDSPAQDGTATGITWASDTSGPFGTVAPFFDGVNDFIDIYSAAFSSAFNGATGSASIWMRVANVGVWTDGAKRNPLSILRSTGAANQMYLRKEIANNQFGWWYTAGGASANIPRNGEDATAWVHLAATWSDQANADEFKAFWNGTQNGATSAAAGVWVAGALHATRTCIGAWAIAPTDSLWHGWLAHAAIWDRVLTADEILGLANP